MLLTDNDAALLFDDVSFLNVALAASFMLALNAGIAVNQLRYSLVLEVVMTDLAVFDGPHVRMFAGFARWRAARQAGRDLAVEHMLFDAGQSIRSADLLAVFWRAEALEMDWLGDFLCDPATNEMMAALQAPPEEFEEEDEEMLYTKSMLVTTGTDMYDYS